MSDHTDVYLDHNATTPIAREVADAMWPYLTEHFGNPSSASSQGRTARAAVDLAREQVAQLIAAHPDEVVFTSGGTESNNLAIRGSAAVATPHVAVTSQIEHPATVEPLAHIATQHGWAVHELPVDTECRVRLDEFPSGRVGLGTLILAHNETGAIQPVAEFAARVHSAGGVVNADAAQSVGKIPVAVDDLDVDLLSIAGHKLYGPKGVGALYVRRGTGLTPVMRGGGQEGGIRPGTEDVASIVGLGTAAELAAGLLVSEADRQSDLRDLLWDRLAAAVAGLVRVSPVEGCLPNTLMVAVPGRLGAQLLESMSGLSASTGSACHAGTHTPSAALLAMGIDHATALGALRLTLGRGTTRDEIDHAAAAIVEAVRAS
ncbi:cysteine desulfurase family protein [Janibacter limosus]|uniref:cysteine desulfurase family protein n=1 Tax=Janibacter limosus TaxID=53458 RepID=UPI00083741A5|nr:cysteine desulfurase family protein [Janibacter limosus]